MTKVPNWLPSLVPLSNFNGDWNAYLEGIYAHFKQDFVDSKPAFRGRYLGLKRHPMSYDKEATFWHMIQMGSVEDDRVPDLRRCERICQRCRSWCFY